MRPILLLVALLLSACARRPSVTPGPKVAELPRDPEFDQRATHIKDVLNQSVSPDADPNHAVLSFDEKPGIQALERIAKDKPM